MYDSHSHIIYGVDDGAKGIKESLEMATVAYNFGIDSIIATPHYAEGIYESDCYNNLKRLQHIRKVINESGIGM